MYQVAYKHIVLKSLYMWKKLFHIPKIDMLCFRATDQNTSIFLTHFKICNMVGATKTGLQLLRTSGEIAAENACELLSCA